MVKSKSLGHELVLLRVGLLRAARYLGKEELPLADIVTLLPVMSTTARTVAYLLLQIDGDGFDWNEVLDDIQGDWEIEV
jgi:hypothetical protein